MLRVENFEASLRVVCAIASFVQRRLLKKGAAHSTSLSSGKSHGTFIFAWPWLENEAAKLVMYRVPHSSLGSLGAAFRSHNDNAWVELVRLPELPRPVLEEFLQLRFGRVMQHPMHWQRLLHDCLDPKTNFMDGHWLPRGFSSNGRQRKLSFTRVTRILRWIAWAIPPLSTTL